MKRTALIAVLLLAACGGGEEAHDREDVAACLREQGASVLRADDIIEDDAEGGGIDVEYANGDAATFYFEATEGQAETTAKQAEVFVKAVAPSADVEQRGNVVVAYHQESAGESKDATDACL
jgi:hypothetical protein